MHKIKTGAMIYQVRVQKKISRKELSAGLCSVKTLANYDNGERTPDGLLFHCFMQRMGKIPRVHSHPLHEAVDGNEPGGFFRDIFIGRIPVLHVEGICF